jgi:hypothetical protein
MLKNRFLIALLLFSMSLSACGIFHKSCNCPHFGEIKTPPKALSAHNV